MREISGEYRLKHMDEFVDELTREQIMFDIVLPRLPKREVLQDQGLLEEKISPLETELQRLMEEELEAGKTLVGPAQVVQQESADSDSKESQEGQEAKKKHKKDRQRSRSRSKEHKDKKKKHKRKSSADSANSEDERKKKNKKKLKKLLKEERKRQDREKGEVAVAPPKETDDEYWSRLRREQGMNSGA